MSLNDQQREAAFPVHIDLGRKETDMAVPMTPSSSSGKKGKSRTYYPTVYIDNIPGLEQLPKSGCILVEYRRKRLSIEENGDGKDTTGVALELQAFCLPEDFPGEAADDLSQAFGNGPGAADDSEEADETESDDEDAED